MTTKEFKNEDRVFDLRYGWGVVKNDNFGEKYPIYVSFDGGETYIYTKEGKDDVSDINPILSHTEYSTQSECPKVMEVSDYGMKWYKRVVFAEKNGKFIAWDSAETFEEAKYEISTYAWNYAREVQEPREISLQEIADKFGIPVDKIIIKNSD